MSAERIEEYEVIVGLECHVQLLTEAKLFSPAPNRFGDAPNTNVDLVDVGLPGVLPVLNGKVVELAIRLGLALGSDIRRESRFARKHYFYPDLPKGYQISQYAEPILEGGALPIELEGAPEKSVRITRAHLEEDAGKSLHVGGDSALGTAGGHASWLDYNRAGTPLLEVVTEPDLRSADEAAAFFRALRTLVVTLGVCDGNLEEGSMRADANVSVRKRGETKLGQRVELKNINSPRFLAAAIEHEARRQIDELEAGRAIVLETRLWDPDRRESRSMRTKEEAHDYRYFPDPDLPPLTVSEEEIALVEARLPELPRARRARYEEQLGLSAYDARILASDGALAAFFDAALAGHENAKGLANWTLNEVLRVLNDRGLEPDQVGRLLSPAALAGLVRLVDEGVISGKIAKDVFAELVAGRGSDPLSIVEQKGWRVVKDTGALKKALEEVIAASPGEWQKLIEGKPKVLGFFVGQVMKKTGGKADPRELNRLIEEAAARARS
jgi:aspartyl-tRNA(Asn)/glutamyl-tRNA(Gln) amidotransferase subunit B